MTEPALLQQERSIGRLEGRVGALEGWVESFEATTRSQFKDMATSLQTLDQKLDTVIEGVSHARGRMEGGIWMLIKLASGSSVVVMVALTAYKVWFN